MGKIILTDGGSGTSLWAKANSRVPVWRFNIEKPEIVKELHQEYLSAGSEILLANTFGVNAPVLEGSGYTVKEVVSAGVRLAKEAADGKAKVALDIGPLTGLLEPFGEITEEEAISYYKEQIKSGMAENPDLIVLETFMDLEMLKIALGIVNQYDIPVVCSMTFEKIGRTIMGNSIEDMIGSLSDYRVDAIGLNCSLTPTDAVPLMKTFRENTALPLWFKPNAGKPILTDDGTVSEVSAELFAEEMLPVLEHGVTYLGGCCGTNPAYIQSLKEKLTEKGFL